MELRKTIVIVLLPLLLSAFWTKAEKGPKAEAIIKTNPLTLIHSDPYASIGAEFPLGKGWSFEAMLGYHYSSDYGLASSGPIESGFVLNPSVRYYFDQTSLEGAYMAAQIMFREVHFQKPDNFYSTSADVTYRSTGSLWSDNKGKYGYIQDKKLYRGHIYGGYQKQWGRFSLDVFAGVGVRETTSERVKAKYKWNSQINQPIKVGYKTETDQIRMPDVTMGFEVGISF